MLYRLYLPDQPDSGSGSAFNGSCSAERFAVQSDYRLFTWEQEGFSGQ